MKSFEHVNAASTAGAVRLLGPDGHSRPIAGGTDLIGELRLGIIAPERLVNLKTIPGLGDINWGKFFSALYETGYRGSACIEVEDKAFEGSLNDRKISLIQSRNYLRQFVAG
jgi:sugar phosphate isomerase/epimerase